MRPVDQTEDMVVLLMRGHEFINMMHSLAPKPNLNYHNYRLNPNPDLNFNLNYRSVGDVERYLR